MKRLAPQETRTYFVSTTTFGRRSVFQSDQLARLFLDLLKADREKLRYKVHELVLMPNHVHVIVTPAFEVSLEKAVQFMKGGFSFRVKKEAISSFEIWQPGYNSHNIQTVKDYDRHREYIFENPVLAKLAREPDEYPYSSANPAIRKLIDERPPWLKPII
jgi:REP-associated tyrosine transposase